MLPLRLLVAAYDYRPMLGGVATCGFELARELAARDDIELRMIARAGPKSRELDFDAHSGLPTSRIHLSRRTPLAALQLARALRRERKTWKPDAILNLLWLPEGVAARLSGIPYYVIAHGNELVETSTNLRKKLRAVMTPLKRKVLRDARHTFAVSRFTRELALNYCGVPPEQVSVCNNGVNPKEFFPMEATAPEIQEIRHKHGAEGRFVFLTVSRLVDFKGLDFAIRAMKQVVAQEPEALYLICGTGEDEPRLRRLVTELGLARNVCFAGSLPFSELNSHYNACDANVLLTRDDWKRPNFEGFGLVFLEAAACRKTSIAGDSGGIADAVLGGRTGWLVPPTDVDAIARAMLECIQNKVLREARSEAAYQRATTSLTWKRMADQIADRILSDRS